MKPIALLVSLSLAIATPVAQSIAAVPVITDSRIKTFVYNAYDVYSVVTLYGYQTNVEFSPKEEIVTVSVGDRVGWQIVPAGNRLFIRAMEDSAKTNMTVITTERAYQFDLSSNGSELKPLEELAYVVRFYYPEEDASFQQSQPVSAQQLMSVSGGNLSGSGGESYNYNYTFTGPDNLAPLKVFDNGRETYIKLQQTGMAPQVSVVGPDGIEQSVSASSSSDGYLVVPMTAPRIIVRYGDAGFICVYNENA